MLPNEVRLVQFCTLVEAVISQVNKYKISDGIRDNGKTLKILETKIAEEILPVREKLQDRLRGVRAVAGAPATKRQNIGDAQQTALEPGSNGLPPASSGNLDVKATVNSSHRNSREAGEGEGKNVRNGADRSSGNTTPLSDVGRPNGPAGNKFPLPYRAAPWSLTTPQVAMGM